jgi:hypothetical protein
LLLTKAGNVKTAPFPYVVIPNALDDGFYRELVRTKPTPEQIIGDRVPGPNQRFDMPTRAAIETLPEPWKAFCTYHTSGKFLDDVYRVFGVPCPDVGIRENKVGAECQPGLNTPSPELSRVRGVHLDNPREVYAGLFYMAEDDDGGDLTLCKWNGKPKRFYGKLEVEDECVDVVETVPYRANTFVFFLNGPDALHGVTPRQSQHYRNLVNIMYDGPSPLFTVGHGKY